MRNKPMQLSTRGLIAAAIAGTASGYAVAEQAGRVNFVTGDVKATSTDGSVRSLARGDVINSGDKISTGSGRLQLRFTDGGFVSLQPNTVFGVDQYLYANKPPEETSLFFSLLQGGMRTITGAIGKVNKQSYKVRTPVATIGIRGTEYLARVDPKRVLVSVGSGFVYVANESGNITGGAGQAIEAREGFSPRLTDDKPDVTASGAEGEDRYAAEDSEENRQQRMGDQLTLEKNNVVLANGSPPVYTYVEQPDPLPNGSGYSLQTTDPVTGLPVTISGLNATFDPNTGAITSLVQTGGTQSPLLDGQSLGAAAVPTGPTFRPGTLKFVNVDRYGSIGWGEITDGIAETNDFEELPNSVGANEFFGYMIATPSIGFTGGKASYSLKGASAARLNRSSNSGTLDHFNFDLNLLSGLANVDMLVRMTDSSIGDVSVKGEDVSLGGSLTGFSLSGLTTTSTGSFCAASGGCSTNISGMFVANGGQVAASYGINGSSGKITGYAALGLDQYLPQQNEFAIATPYDSYGYASVVQNASGGVVSFYADTCNDGCDSVFDAGTLKFANVGHSGSIYWGEYTDGSGRFTGDESGDLVLGNNEFEAYVTGPQVIPSFNGKATYSLRGGTPARLNGGSTTGTLDHLNLTLDLGFGLADVDMLVKMSGQDISAQGSNLNLSGNNGSNFFINNIATTSTGSFCGSSSCYTYINGFFSGTDGNQVGVGYNIYGNGNEITGVAALGRDSLAAGAEEGYSLLTAYSGEGYIHPGSLEAAFNTDNSINYLVEPSACEGDCVFKSGTLKTNAVGHSTYLRWGEYTNGTALYGDISGLPGTLAGGEYASYIIGKTTSVTAINGAATASYSLRGGTPARVLEGSGAATSATLDLFKLDLNLFSGLVNIDMGLSGVGTGNEGITVTGRNISLPLLGMGVDGSGNLVDSYPGVFQITNGLTTTSTGSFCAEGCNTYINGMFAGDASEIGAAYFINGYSSISGVAALGLDSKTTGNTNALKTGSGYILVADRGNNVILTNGNPYSTSDINETVFDTSGKLQSFTTLYAGEGSSTALDAGSATRASGSESGTYKTLHWGRLTGTGQQVTYYNETGPLGDVAAPENIHYVVGTVTDPYSWQALNQGYSGGTATYSVVGKTNPTDSNGNVGTLNSASLTLHLNTYQPKLDVALNVSMGSNTYAASSTGNNLGYLGCGPAAATFSVSGMSTTVNGSSCGGSGCYTSVHGFFSGSQAQQAGMSYSIQDTGTANTTITGAAALKADSLTPPVTTPPI